MEGSWLEKLLDWMCPSLISSCSDLTSTSGIFIFICCLLLLLLLKRSPFFSDPIVSSSSPHFHLPFYLFPWPLPYVAPNQKSFKRQISLLQRYFVVKSSFIRHNSALWWQLKKAKVENGSLKVPIPWFLVNKKYKGSAKRVLAACLACHPLLFDPQNHISSRQAGVLPQSLGDLAGYNRWSPALQDSSSTASSNPHIEMLSRQAKNQKDCLGSWGLLGRSTLYSLTETMFLREGWVAQEINTRVLSRTTV